VGDLIGICDRLDYLHWLGVDAIWLSPIFASPMADFGYDISDYRAVDPVFGALDDLDALITEAHRRGIRVLLDFVPNHTSDEHPWFKEARSSSVSPKRDWYMWADPRPDGSPPNNWRSLFGGSAWELDPASGQFYLHSFLRQQPELNWRNPAVRAEMYDTLRFWFERGIDGFRIDVLWLLIKDDQLRDNPPRLPLYTADRPEVMDIVAEMREVADEYSDRVLIGEIYLPIERLVAYYGSSGGEAGRPGIHLPFNFQLIELPWDAAAIAGAIAAYEAALPPHGWPNWVLGNHDQHRVATRVGDDQARVAAMLLLTLRGTPTLYYGDEIGMRNVNVPAEQQQDPARFDSLTGGRDPERSPMRWDATPGAGFTSGDPWLPIGDDLSAVNVASQQATAGSMLELHRRLIELRRSESALTVGNWAPVSAAGEFLVYERSFDNRRLIVALNLGQHQRRLDLGSLGAGTVLLSTELDRQGEKVSGATSIRGAEGLIVALSNQAPSSVGPSSESSPSTVS